ncbi:hypothetical protein H7J77_01870 [Mycolicibacillus parakoreensis]|uniref:Lipoprotein n=1 Tax=Mycolicibacillus parakoreensis TaxID=1069221 RepID=A0ABY3U2F3_9MYCO|nr:hypothetical protein [Mycolicibacillus parakoreensis]MCV7314299.1 hypothetical protein [Mycolicibacillus parakoreensis]ULN53344.1 hypothetical protein MIU77_03060 [Mycolicibacillus parakoreensis]
MTETVTVSPRAPRRRIVFAGRGALTALSLAGLVAAATLGCSTTVHGGASKAPPSADASDLNPGNYPTAPRPTGGKAGPKAGPYVEARRMSDFVTMPFEVDPDLTGGLGKIGTFNGPFKGADAVGVIFDTVFPEAAGRDYVTGFMTSREHTSDTTPNLHNAVLRYATPEAAAAAAAELGTNGGPDPTKYPDNTAPDSTPTSIPRHAETRAITWGPSESFTVAAYTAHGPYLLAQESYSKTGSDDAINLVADALDKQIPLIDRFTPTPVDEIADLQLDPDGLLARTVEPPVDERGRFRFGLYGVHGFLAYSDDPAGDEKLLTDAGVDLIALAGTDVYRARDAAGADQIVSAWTEIRGEDWDSIDGVPGLPDSHCFKTVTSPGSDYSRSHYSCLLTADRYAIDVASSQKDAVYQQAAAQYLMLTAE